METSSSATPTQPSGAALLGERASPAISGAQVRPSWNWWTEPPPFGPRAQGDLAHGRSGAVGRPLAPGEVPNPPPVPSWIRGQLQNAGDSSSRAALPAMAGSSHDDAFGSLSQSQRKDGSESTTSTAIPGSQSSDVLSWGFRRSQTDPGPSQSSQSTAQSCRNGRVARGTQPEFVCSQSTESAGMALGRSQQDMALSQTSEAAVPPLPPAACADPVDGIITPERVPSQDGNGRSCPDRSRSPPALSAPQPQRLYNLSSVLWGVAATRRSHRARQAREDRLSRAASNAHLEADIARHVREGLEAADLRACKMPKTRSMTAEFGSQDTTPSQRDVEASQDSLASVAHATGHLTLSRAVPLGQSCKAHVASKQPATRVADCGPSRSDSAKPADESILETVASLPMHPKAALTLPIGRTSMGLPAGQSPLALACSISSSSCVTPKASPAVPPLLEDDGMISPPGRMAAVPATPEARGVPWHMAPPPAPSLQRERREQESDIKVALEWNSEPLLTMTLLSAHAHECSLDHALHQAVQSHHQDALRFLLERGASGLEEPCRGERPLMKAVRACLMEGDEGFRMVEMLLQHGARVSAPADDAEQDTPLHDAAQRGGVALAGLLLRYGADPNLPNAFGRTPLHTACLQLPWQQEPALVEMLVDHGADPRLRDNSGRLPQDLILGHPMAQLVLQRLERETRWLERRSAVLARGRGTGQHPVCRVPDLIFRAVAQFL